MSAECGFITTDYINKWQELLHQLPKERRDISYLPEYVASVSKTEIGGCGGLWWWYCKGHTVIFPLIQRPLPKGMPGIDIVAPYEFGGPIADQQEVLAKATDDFARYWRSRGALSLFWRQHPFLGKKEFLKGWGEIVKGKPHIIRDVTLRGSGSISSYAKLAQRNIKKAIKSGVTVEISKGGCWDDFWMLYDKNLRRLKAAMYYFFNKDFRRAMADRCGNMFWIARARTSDGSLAAVALFLLAWPVIFYYLGARDEAYDQFRPTNLLFHQVIVMASEKGFATLHLGGGNESLRWFKRQYGTESLAYCYGRWVLDPSGYSKMNHMLRVKEDKRSIFPAYRSMSGVDES